jgi:hypothetical protein
MANVITDIITLITINAPVDAPEAMATKYAVTADNDKIIHAGIPVIVSDKV